MTRRLTICIDYEVDTAAAALRAELDAFRKRIEAIRLVGNAGPLVVNYDECDDQVKD